MTLDSDVLASINSDNALDVYMQDDTGVDYMVLTVWICCVNTINAGIDNINLTILKG